MSVIEETISTGATTAIRQESSLSEDTTTSTLTKKMQWSTVVILLAFVVIASCMQSTAASPVHKDWSHDTTPISEDCKGEIQTLCQRCAKSTRSNIVYPMCCANTEDARTWCHSYINFGIQTDSN